MKSPLRIAREKQHLTLGALAVKVGSDVGNLSRIERGRQIPSSELAEKICGCFPKGELTELQLIYPQRYMQTAEKDPPTPPEDDRRRPVERRKCCDRRGTS